MIKEHFSAAFVAFHRLRFPDINTKPSRMDKDNNHQYQNRGHSHNTKVEQSSYHVSKSHYK